MRLCFFFLMHCRAPRSTRTRPLFPYTALCRSPLVMGPLVVGPLVVGMAGTALADVDLTSSVSTGLTLTDNRGFEHDAESDLILSLTPRIGLRQVGGRSEEHTSELQTLMRISYAVFCLKQKKEENKMKQ